MTDSVTFTLSKSIEHKGKTYSQFTFNEATAGDLALGDAVTGELTKTLAILSGMADVELAVMRKVKARDLGKLTTAVAPLLGESEPVIGPA